MLAVFCRVWQSVPKAKRFCKFRKISTDQAQYTATHRRYQTCCTSFLHWPLHKAIRTTIDLYDVGLVRWNWSSDVSGRIMWPYDEQHTMVECQLRQPLKVSEGCKGAPMAALGCILFFLYFILILSYLFPLSITFCHSLTLTIFRF